MAALDVDQLTTDPQRQRRERILDAAVDAASAGGYDGVHMRDISERASVAIATLYHHFPSKVHLLTKALERELIRFDDRLNRDLPDRTNPLMRLRLGVHRLIDGMERSDRITNALTHAFVASHVVASFEAEMVRIQTSELFTHLMSNGAATEMHRDVADLLTDVWTAEVLALVQERKTYDDMRTRLDAVIGLFARGMRTPSPIEVVGAKTPPAMSPNSIAPARQQTPSTS